MNNLRTFLPGLAFLQAKPSYPLQASRTAPSSSNPFAILFWLSKYPVSLVRFCAWALVLLTSSSLISNAQAQTLPSPRINSTYVTDGGNQIGWTAVSGATNYQVFRSLTSGSYSTTPTLTTTARGVSFPGLTNGTTYYYVVRAYNGTLSTASNEVALTPTPNPPPPPTLTIGDASVTEGNSGFVSMIFPVTLSSPATQDVSFPYSIPNYASNTATKDVDYVNTTGTGRILFGESSTSIVVQIKGDTTIEADEKFELDTGSIFNTANQYASAIGTIIDDDFPTLTVANASVAEGNSGTTPLVFTFTLSQASPRTISVVVNTSQGTATAGSDYQAVGHGTVTFAPGTTTQTFTVQVVGDTVVEADEQFRLDLRSPSGATLGTTYATGTILNDDAPAARKSSASSS